MERQRREEEQKRPSKKPVEAEQSAPNRASSPQGQQSGGSLKSMKEKPGQQDKDTQEPSSLKTAGPDGEITAAPRHLLVVGDQSPHAINDSALATLVCG
ncbi:Dynamin-2A like [Senna tora]|uniref:Dynamin-2A like n=1 Tax=Senna tora TaxID=362788 RepID=A0A834VYL9_9FABA|nr:Dynamin-2A like [Senna tora]